MKVNEKTIDELAAKAEKLIPLISNGLHRLQYEDCQTQYNSNQPSYSETAPIQENDRHSAQRRAE